MNIFIGGWDASNHSSIFHFDTEPGRVYWETGLINSSGYLYTKESIDLSKFKKVCLDLDYDNVWGPEYFIVLVIDSVGGAMDLTRSAYDPLEDPLRHTLTLDLDGCKEGHVAIGIRSFDSSSFFDCWLE